MANNFIPNILICGIEQAIFETVCQAWDKYKAELFRVTSLVEAVREITKSKYHLVCIVLPDDREERAYTINQIKIIRDLSDAPIIVLTHDPFDPDLMIKALEDGADDFQVCPGTLEEAAAIGMALIRRYTQFNTGQKEHPFTMLITENILISVDLRKVFVRGKEVELLRKEFDILTMLIRSQGRVFTHEQIFREVWGEDYVENSKETLWNQIYSLRKKLQIEPGMPEFIETVHGVGYRFNP